MPRTPSDRLPSSASTGVSRPLRRRTAVLALLGCCALLAALVGTALARPGRGGGGYPPPGGQGPGSAGAGQQQGAGPTGAQVPGRQPADAGGGPPAASGQSAGGPAPVGPPSRHRGAGATPPGTAPPAHGGSGSRGREGHGTAGAGSQGPVGGGQQQSAGSPRAQTPTSGQGQRQDERRRSGQGGPSGAAQGESGPSGGAQTGTSQTATATTGTSQTGTATAGDGGHGAGRSRHTGATAGDGSTHGAGSSAASGSGFPSASSGTGSSSTTGLGAAGGLPSATAATSPAGSSAASSSSAGPPSTSPTGSVGASPTAGASPSAPRARRDAGRPFRARAPRRRGHSRRRGLARRSHPLEATGARALSPGPLLAAAGAGQASSPARHRPATDRRRAAGRLGSPLSTTITRIVDVVPAPLRIVIALLVALSLLLALRSRLAALRAKRLERQRAELLADVGLLQAALLPTAPDALGEVGTSVAYRPADGPAAGGDFYDVFPLDEGRFAVILGDVSGHGRQALPHTALVRFTLRAYLEAGLSPRLALQTAGLVLERQLGESFATVAVATYDPTARRLVYACAGHPPPLVLGSERLAALTVCSAPPVGAGLRTGTRQTTVELPGRARICLYTDGVTEARVGGELFGIDRLAQAVTELGPHDDAAALLGAVTRLTDARPDDMAACLLDVPGELLPPSIHSEEIELDRRALAGERLPRFLSACGVDSRDVPALVRSARDAAGATGLVVLELRIARDGAPQVTLQRPRRAQLRPPQPHQPIAVGASA